VDHKEERIVSKRSSLGWMVVGLALGAVAPLAAQGAEAAGSAGSGSGLTMVVASILTAGFALGIAAGLGALGQGRAIGSAAEAIARNPSAAGEIRGVLILGLVLIESLVIYVLAISLILFFLKPFAK
jgi:F-type H+-transporting ATPase subunit c